MSKVSVVGLGYVGLPLALLAAKNNYEVAGIDLSQDKVKKINSRIDPLGDEYIETGLSDTTLKAVTNFDQLGNSEIVIVCVPTPVKDDYQPDLEPLKGAVTSVAKQLSKNTLVIIESTINPGVCDEIVIPLIEKESGLKVNQDFYVSHCPERINPGDTKWNVENIPRVAGSSSQAGLDKTITFYESILDADIKPMASIKEAEAVKVVENSFRDINIAFVNELAMSFSKLGINVRNVIEGSATKPFGFMPFYPSVGVGGHCIPVDPYYLIEYARGYGFEHEFLSLARSINNHMPEFTVEQLNDGLNEAGLTLKGSQIAVLGLAYKPDVADDRESPSYRVIRHLEEKGAKVDSYDPFFLEKSTAKSLESALKDKQAVVVATNHQEFLDMDLSKLKVKVFLDGKNAFDKSKLPKNIVYRGIGVR
ncbi:MAG: nucleotide sugar dehydrogenase [Candidatus Saccharimonadales bacterium]